MNLRRSLSQIALIIGTLLFSLGLQTYAQTWTAPTASPPASNAYAPLTTGPTAQIKTGGLILGAGDALTALIVQNGNVGIGTVAPKRQFVISHPTAPLIGLETSSNGLGWFMYADAGSPSGFHIGNYTDSTWTSPANYPFNVTSAGNVGIGTTVPSAELSVNGVIQSMTGGIKFPDGTVQTTAGGSSRFTLTQTYFFGGNGASQGATTGPHDFCAQSGMYQNGNNGWIYMTADAPDANGKRNYTVTSTCAAQGCGSGAMVIKVDCYDFQ